MNKDKRDYNEDCKKFKRVTIRTTPKIFELLKKSPDETLQEVSDIDPIDAFVIGFWIRDLLDTRHENAEIIE